MFPLYWPDSFIEWSVTSREVCMTVSSTSQGSAYSCIRIIDFALNLSVRSHSVHLLYIFFDMQSPRYLRTLDYGAKNRDYIFYTKKTLA